MPSFLPESIKENHRLGPENINSEVRCPICVGAVQARHVQSHLEKESRTQNWNSVKSLITTHSDRMYLVEIQLRARPPPTGTAVHV